jgi:hypothetical protein
MQVCLPAQIPHAKMRDGGGIGGKVLADVRLSMSQGLDDIFKSIRREQSQIAF